MKPTKIIAAPFLRPTGARDEWVCKCDDQQYYTFRELADLKGFSSNVFYERWRRRGHWKKIGRLRRQKTGRKPER